jgi:hypothetical protein
MGVAEDHIRELMQQERSWARPRGLRADDPRLSLECWMRSGPRRNHLGPLSNGRCGAASLGRLHQYHDGLPGTQIWYRPRPLLW